ncbi:hypothetical protein Pcinc_041984 [Petrolisthes cinctipes]|uniref:Uncharacterized protein n=1 Tax=Petrolisthes cinctipes TaxID=88211 RepID=A0AAE1BM68_PETCI|nr:hypothetical protein Pcinc_041984 [Petrolisthes cinctipes]
MYNALQSEKKTTNGDDVCIYHEGHVGVALLMALVVGTAYVRCPRECHQPKQQTKEASHHLRLWGTCTTRDVYYS